MKLNLLKIIAIVAISLSLEIFLPAQEAENKQPESAKPESPEMDKTKNDPKDTMDPIDQEQPDKKKGITNEEANDLLKEIDEKMYGGKLGQILSNQYKAVEKVYKDDYTHLPTGSAAPLRMDDLSNFLRTTNGQFPEAIERYYKNLWPALDKNPAAQAIIDKGLGASLWNKLWNKSLWDGSRYR